MSTILPTPLIAGATPPVASHQYSVFVDARMIHNTGIGRHIREHLRCLAGKGHTVYAAVSSEAGRHEVARLSPAATVVLSPAKIYGFRERFSSLSGIARFNDNCDVFWFPQYNTPWFMPTPSVVTIHDLIQFRYNLASVNNIELTAAKKVLANAMRRAQRIVCVSKATRSDLLELDPSMLEKISVVHNGVSSFWSRPHFEGHKKTLSITKGRPYLLSVSQKKPHKNQGLLLRLIEKLAEKHYDHLLILVGESTPQWLDTFKTWARQAKAVDRVIDLHGQVDDVWLASLYAKASVFLLPSLYEGFGLPALEAMAAGTPVVVSNRGALPEIVGAAAGDPIDPLDFDAWEDRVICLLESESERRRLAELGRVHASSFSWEEKTRQLLQVFHAAIYG